MFFFARAEPVWLWDLIQNRLSENPVGEFRKTAQSCPSAPTPSQKASLVDNGLFSDCEKPAMCHWIGLHHMLVMFASQSWAQMCTATHLRDCTSAQTMHWSVVKMVFEAGFRTQVTCWRRSWRKDCLWSVKVQLMKNQKSDSEDYLTKSNYLK